MQKAVLVFIFCVLFNESSAKVPINKDHLTNKKAALAKQLGPLVPKWGELATHMKDSKNSQNKSKSLINLLKVVSAKEIDVPENKTIGNIINNATHNENNNTINNVTTTSHNTTTYKSNLNARNESEILNNVENTIGAKLANLVTNNENVTTNKTKKKCLINDFIKSKYPFEDKANTTLLKTKKYPANETIGGKLANLKLNTTTERPKPPEIIAPTMIPIFKPMPNPNNPRNVLQTPTSDMIRQDVASEEQNPHGFKTQIPKSNASTINPSQMNAIQNRLNQLEIGNKNALEINANILNLLQKGLLFNDKPISNDTAQNNNRTNLVEYIDYFKNNLHTQKDLSEDLNLVPFGGVQNGLPQNNIKFGQKELDFANINTVKNVINTTTTNPHQTAFNPSNTNSQANNFNAINLEQYELYLSNFDQGQKGLNLNTSPDQNEIKTSFSNINPNENQGRIDFNQNSFQVNNIQGQNRNNPAMTNIGLNHSQSFYSSKDFLPAIANVEQNIGLSTENSGLTSSLMSNKINQYQNRLDDSQLQSDQNSIINTKNINQNEFTPLVINTKQNGFILSNSNQDQREFIPKDSYLNQNDFNPSNISPGQNMFNPNIIKPGQNTLNPSTINLGQTIFDQSNIIPGYNIFNPSHVDLEQNIFNPKNSGEVIFHPSNINPGQNILNPSDIDLGQNVFDPNYINKGQKNLNPSNINPGQNILNPSNIDQGQNIFHPSNMNLGQNILNPSKALIHNQGQNILNPSNIDRGQNVLNPSNSDLGQNIFRPSSINPGQNILTPSNIDQVQNIFNPININPGQNILTPSNIDQVQNIFNPININPGQNILSPSNINLAQTIFEPSMLNTEQNIISPNNMNFIQSEISSFNKDIRKPVVNQNNINVLENKAVNLLGNQLNAIDIQKQLEFKNVLAKSPNENHIKAMRNDNVYNGLNVQTQIEKYENLQKENGPIFTKNIIADYGQPVSNNFVNRLNIQPQIENKIPSNNFQTENIRQQNTETLHKKIDLRAVHPKPQSTGFNLPCFTAADILEDLYQPKHPPAKPIMNPITEKAIANLQVEKPITVEKADDALAIVFKPKDISLLKVYGDLLKKITLTVLVPYHVSKLASESSS